MKTCHEDVIDALALVDGDVSDIDDRVTQNETDISNQSVAISANASDISSNSSAINTNTSNISTNTSNISTNSSNISSNDTELADHESRIASLEGGGSSMQAGYIYSDAYGSSYIATDTDVQLFRESGNGGSSHSFDVLYDDASLFTYNVSQSFSDGDVYITIPSSGYIQLFASYAWAPSNIGRRSLEFVIRNSATSFTALSPIQRFTKYDTTSDAYFHKFSTGFLKIGSGLLVDDGDLVTVIVKHNIGSNLSVGASGLNENIYFGYALM